MSLQLDSDADAINNVVISAAAGQEEGLTMVEPIMKEDLPIDLRAKLIIAMINLGLTPSEVQVIHTSVFHSTYSFLLSAIMLYFHSQYLHISM